MGKRSFIYYRYMLRKVPLTTGEVYHVFNRGAHKQKIFLEERDYRRFQLNLHVANHTEPIVIREILESQKYKEPFSGFRSDKSLVDILAYSLMPNHFHLILRQKTDGGISRFMRKTGVGYSMYYNVKYSHSGVLFQGRFQSRHIDNEAYFRWIFSYVHLNPIDLLIPSWEKARIAPEKIKGFINTYVHSSFLDLSGETRPEGAILSTEDLPDFLKNQNDLEIMLESYTKNHPEGFPENGSLGIGS
jgi:putative transposase